MKKLIRHGRAVFLILIMLCILPATSTQAAIKFRAKVPRTSFLAGEQAQISFTNTKRITYRFKSSNKKIFTVSAREGLITARKKGKATLTITGTWKKGSKKTVWKKKVTIRVSKCALSAKKISLKQGKTKKLSVVNLDVKRKIRWYSETPETCQVNSSGKVTALRTGSGTVCAQVGNYVVLRCQVTITATVLQAETIRLLVNATHTYGCIDLAAEMRGDTKSSAQVNLTVKNEGIGHLEGNLYYADGYGTNSVTAYCGGYEKVFTISQYVWAAHRGYTDMFPENSIDAFEGAVFAGAGFIETDIRVTSDLVPVCMHDAQLANMTNSAKDATVYKMTFEELRQLEINNGNCLDRLVHKQVPTLEEYLKICSRYGIIAIIELKHLGNGKKDGERKTVVEDIMRLLAQTGMTRRCIMHSANAELLSVFRTYAGEEGQLIPVSTTTLDVWKKLQPYHLQNAYSSYGATPFGYAKIYDYSPLVGRKNKAADSYHTRVSTK